jgi:hypothetical protein
MNRIFRLTTLEFIGALNRAYTDDLRWPNLCSRQWLIEHARTSDGEVIITTNGQNAPRPPADKLRD